MKQYETHKNLKIWKLSYYKHGHWTKLVIIYDVIILFSLYPCLFSNTSLLWAYCCLRSRQHGFILQRFVRIYHNLVDIRGYCHMLRCYCWVHCFNGFPLGFFSLQYPVVLQRMSRPQPRLQRSSLCPGWPLPKTLWTATCWASGSSTGPTCPMEVHPHTCTLHCTWGIEKYFLYAGPFTLVLTLACYRQIKIFWDCIFNTSLQLFSYH